MQIVKWTAEGAVKGLRRKEMCIRDRVVSAVIEQSQAVPTGTVRLTLRDGSERQVNVPDTIEARDLLQKMCIRDR